MRFSFSARRRSVLTIIVLAIGVSALFNIKNILLYVDAVQAGQTYTYFTFMNPDAFANLAPIIRDGLDGHWRSTDGRLAEHVDDPNVWSVYLPGLYVPFLAVIGSVPETLLVFRLLCAAIAFVALVFLLQRVIPSRRASYVLSAVFLLTALFWYFFPPVSLAWARVVARGLLPLGSPPGEIILAKYNSIAVAPGLPLMIIALLGVLITLQKKTIVWAVATGVVLGIMTTLYVTHGMYVSLLLAIATFLLLLRKQWSVIRPVFWLTLSMIVSAAPFLWSYIHVRLSPVADELLLRLGGDQTHAFRTSEWFMYLVYILFAGLTWQVARRRASVEVAAFLTAGVLVAIAVLNLQVLTGFNPEPTVWRIHQIFYGFFLAWAFLGWQAVVWLQKRFPKRRLFILLAALLPCVMLVGRGVHAELYAYEYTRGLATLPPAYNEAMQWLNSHTPKDSVVAAPSFTSNTILPVFSHNRVLIGKALTSAAPEWELIDRLFVVYALYGVTPEHVEDGLRQRVTISDSYALNAEDAFIPFLFEYRFISTALDAFYHDGDKRVPEEVIAELVASYRRYPRRLGYLLSRYQMDYLFVGPLDRRLMHADFLARPYLEKVYDAGGIQIYQLHRDRI